VGETAACGSPVSVTEGTDVAGASMLQANTTSIPATRMIICNFLGIFLRDR
jgi:hypothetical protein